MKLPSLPDHAGYAPPTTGRPSTVADGDEPSGTPRPARHRMTPTPEHCMARAKPIGWSPLPPMTGRLRRVLVAATFATGTIFAAILGDTQGPDNMRDVASAQVPDRAIATPAMALPPGTATLGESRAVNGLGVIVRAASRAGSYGYTYAAEGRSLLVIEAEILNPGDASRPISGSWFSVIDLDARASWPAILPVAIGLLPDGRLGPDERASGRVVFEIPGGASNLLVRFDPGAFDPAAAYWLASLPGATASPSPAASPMP